MIECIRAITSVQIKSIKIVEENKTIFVIQILREFYFTFNKFSFEWNNKSKKKCVLHSYCCAVVALERFHLPSFNYLIIFFANVILNVLYSPVARLLLNRNDEEKYACRIIVRKKAKKNRIARAMDASKILNFKRDLNFHSIWKSILQYISIEGKNVYFLY